MRPARADEIDELQGIVQLAFATQFGLPTPAAFGDRMTIGPRWRAHPERVFAAELDGRLAGSSVVTIWGSAGWFGPLTVHPEFWNRRIAQALMEPTMAALAAAGTTVDTLYTLPASPKHIALYQKYDFWPRRLTAAFTRPPDATLPVRLDAFSALDAAGRGAALAATRVLTGSVFAGLDVCGEIVAVAAQGLGETLLLHEAGALRAFAICHHGAGSEGGSRDCAVKFGAALDEPAFERLVDGVVAYAATTAAARVVLPVNAARERAYRCVATRGFTIATLGVAMVRGGSAYDGAADYVIEDHR